MSTKIEWCDETWNPITGCTPISEGCQNCYAERMTARNLWDYDFTPGTEHADRWERPHHWRKSRRIFVCSMGDLFHDSVPQWMIRQVVQYAEWLPRHAFILLTKRPQRMLSELNLVHVPPNLWLGVTAENQKRADERIPILLQIPAAVRFVSVEPALGKVSLWDYMMETNPNYQPPRFLDEGESYDVPNSIPRDDRINWVIWGPETGSGARKAKKGWRAELHRQCQRADVPFFDKSKVNWVSRYWPNQPARPESRGGGVA